MNDEYEDFVKQFAYREEGENLFALTQFVFALVQNVVQVTGMDPCVVTGAIVNHLAGNIILNGHPKCANRMADDIVKMIEAYKTQTKH